MADGKDVHLLDEAGLVGGDELGERDQRRPQLLPRVGQTHAGTLLQETERSVSISFD